MMNILAGVMLIVGGVLVIWTAYYYLTRDLHADLNWLFRFFPGETVEKRVEILKQVLPTSVQQSVLFVRVSNNASDFPDGEHGNCRCRKWGSGVLSEIRLWKESFAVDPSGLWHEYGHAWQAVLEESKSPFREKWLEVSGARFDRDYEEDVSEWLRHFCLATGGYFSRFSWLDFLSRINLSNRKAVSRRLSLLREYGFVNVEDHDRFIQRYPIFN